MKHINTKENNNPKEVIKFKTEVNVRESVISLDTRVTAVSIILPEEIFVNFHSKTITIKHITLGECTFTPLTKNNILYFKRDVYVETLPGLHVFEFEIENHFQDQLKISPKKVELNDYQNVLEVTVNYVDFVTRVNRKSGTDFEGTIGVKVRKESGGLLGKVLIPNTRFAFFRYIDKDTVRFKVSLRDRVEDEELNSLYVEIV